MKTFFDWLLHMWEPPPANEDRASLTARVFNTAAGQEWLKLQLTEIYCTVSASNDHGELVARNAQRALIHGILQELDEFANPHKYKQAQVEEMSDARTH